ncbi:DNA/RNA helicase domain-containing protein [Nocardia sp. NPDC057353]|uniref:DNA/RNA helicase domain-containing protein n=1 Tax=Nocardia sp. NPDC057353 TaxID=3346104 RepID=UPI00362E27DA
MLVLPVFRATAQEVLDFESQDALAAAIAAATHEKGKGARARSWTVSGTHLARLLVGAGLGMVEMLVEYPLPKSSNKKIDVLLAGVDPQGGDSYVAVELKQWSEAELVGTGERIVRTRFMPGEHLHPVEQVRGYCLYLQQFVEILHHRPGAVHGVAYLHNATRDSVAPLLSAPITDLGRMFTGDRSADLVQYLLERFAPKSGAAAADRLLNSPNLDRRPFLDFVHDELRAPTDYVLLDNQQVAYETVLHRVEAAARDPRKSIVLVTGGPGSGKTKIAVALLSALQRRDKRVHYATGSVAVTESMRRFPGRRSPQLKKLFTYYRDFARVEENHLDVLICDEAHRIRQTSNNRWVSAEHRTKGPQIDELMAAARVPVFLLDEDQVVRPDEVGRVDYIRDHAARAGYLVHQITLDGQFRCGGSAEYDEWVRRLLGIRVGGPTPWTGTDFDVRVAANPLEMEEFLRAENEAGATARMTAGFCWPWSPANPDGTLVPDVRIGSWHRPWNKKADNFKGDTPPSSVWATDQRGFGQIGCVYTAQGFEYDWAGVILGPDIAYDGHRLRPRRGHNLDPSMRSSRKTPLADHTIDTLIRNVYKVLLTRPMRGVVIHATDPATNAYLTDLVHRSNSEIGCTA